MDEEWCLGHIEKVKSLFGEVCQEDGNVTEVPLNLNGHCHSLAYRFSITKYVLQNLNQYIVPLQAFTRHPEKFSIMGTPSLQPFLKS